MFEEAMQELDKILKDRSLYNPDKIRVRLDKEAYARRRIQFGEMMEVQVRTAITIGKYSYGGIDTTEIRLKFPKVDHHLNSDNSTCNMVVERKKKNILGNRTVRNVIVTISFKRGNWFACRHKRGWELYPASCFLCIRRIIYFCYFSFWFWI